MSLPKNEISRQEAIHELIYTEEDYVRDLRLLDEVNTFCLRMLFFLNTIKALCKRIAQCTMY